ncbi:MULTISPECIES: PEPxxWA-CTERM sorting domain-containing protein [Sphingosinicellaceae]|uniref:PEPxxWA-CTERM sorting domain-containing protein n=1 Tax=Sphingosinicellaceae TaxID=2820280 RepID=UPI001C1DE234|nr:MULTISPECIES: PEPxxWA-CTERM sorting domain-containing protein [Polymorphobacter]QYE35362.1 PEPxxWA-CTERM sorting domain-containing protein [Polymorphobacter sp. PAMC 29334]UAJ11331.1 PEPxxWA-CTERM sorting domain-containing protein [Polymorphobacter megasporae]
MTFGFTRGLVVALGMLAAVPADALVIYQSAAYSGVDSGEYILSENNFMGAVFTLGRTTAITGIGAQFGGFPGGNIFGAIVPLSSRAAFPAGKSTDLADISLGHVVFAVTGATQDLVAPLPLTLSAGTYGVIFGSGQFGATGYAGLGYENTPSGSPTLFRSFFSDDWASFSDTGVRITVEGATAAVPEPAAWALMIAGFGMVGFAARRRTRTAIA